MSAVDYENLAAARQGETSKNIRERVIRSRQIQQEWFQNSSTRNNAGMTRKLLEKYAQLLDAPSKILEQAMAKLGLSARAYDRILKVLRTIADLTEQENIDTFQVAEAIQYRKLEQPI